MFYDIDTNYTSVSGSVLSPSCKNYTLYSISRTNLHCLVLQTLPSCSPSSLSNSSCTCTPNCVSCNLTQTTCQVKEAMSLTNTVSMSAVQMQYYCYEMYQGNITAICYSVRVSVMWELILVLTDTNFSFHLSHVRVSVTCHLSHTCHKHITHMSQTCHTDVTYPIY